MSQASHIADEATCIANRIASIDASEMAAVKRKDMAAACRLWVLGNKVLNEDVTCAVAAQRQNRIVEFSFENPGK